MSGTYLEEPVRDINNSNGTKSARKKPMDVTKTKWEDFIK